MLVLSRKVGEKIVIGENITVVVQRIGKGRVALAIEAPHEVTVLRAELAPFGISHESEELPAKSAVLPTRQAEPEATPAIPRENTRGLSGPAADSRTTRPVPPRLRQAIPDLLSGRPIRPLASH